MTDPRDSAVMENFLRMFGGGGPTVVDTAMEVPSVLIELDGLLDDLDNDVDLAASDDDALARWSDASPETRSAILLNLAWQTRESYRPAEFGASTGADYAAELHRYARTFTGDDVAFHGNAFPAMPLAGQAGALAMSMGFDREDLPISLETALLFLAVVTKHQSR